jgi:hypothetical protein
MDDVDIFLGYPWMDSIGTINISVKKTFFKVWYEKTKIKLKDISLTKQEGTKGELEEVLVEKLNAVPTKKSSEESKVESKEEPTKSHQENPQEVHEKEENIRS